MKLRHTILSAVALAVAGTSTATMAAKQDEPVAIKQWSYDSLYNQGGIEGNKLLGGEVFGSGGHEIGNIENVLIRSYCQIWCMQKKLGGFPAEFSFVYSVDELHAVDELGELLEAA